MCDVSRHLNIFQHWSILIDCILHKVATCINMFELNSKILKALFHVQFHVDNNYGFSAFTSTIYSFNSFSSNKDKQLP